MSGHNKTTCMTRLQQDVCDSKALVQLLGDSLRIARYKLAMDETRLAEVARRRKCPDNLEEWEEIYVNQHTPDVPGVSAGRPSNQDSDVAIPSDEYTNTVRAAAKASADAKWGGDMLSDMVNGVGIC